MILFALICCSLNRPHIPLRLYRAYYELKTSLFEMWRGNPALTAVLFGLPMGFFALICYSICCSDIMDAEEEGEEDGEENEMKQINCCFKHCDLCI